MSKQLPYHYWQWHKKIYWREWLTLDKNFRAEVVADREGPSAKMFYGHVKKLAEEMFLDESNGYNSKYRFQYSH